MSIEISSSWVSKSISSINVVLPSGHGSNRATFGCGKETSSMSLRPFISPPYVLSLPPRLAAIVSLCPSLSSYFPSRALTPCLIFDSTTMTEEAAALP